MSLDLDYFEQIILRESLTDQAYLASIMEYAKEEHFQDPDVRKIFKVILPFFQERGVPPSIGEIKTRMLEDGDKKILQNCYNKIKDLSDVNSKEELICNTESFFKQRSLYGAVLKVAEEISSGKLVDVGETLLDIESAYNITLSDSLGLWYFRDLDKHIEELKTIYTPIPTGWDWFDSRTEGGLFPKTLNVFIGQVNVGKSIVLGNIATNLVQRDLNVVLISLEMSEFMYAKRISAQLSQIPCSMLKDNEEELKEAIERVRKQIDSHLIIKEYPPKSITVAHIDGYLTKLKHKGIKVDVLVVDYLNLIKPVGKNLNSYEGVKEVAEALRALAFKYDIPVASVSQINRGGFSAASPGMESVSESIALPATADVMCNIWQEEEEKELGLMHLGFIKNRFGPNFGRKTFRINYSTLTMTETNDDYFAPDDKQDDEVENVSNALDKLTGP